MIFRVFPKFRYFLKPSFNKKWGDWEDVTMDYLIDYMRRYFPTIQYVVGKNSIEFNEDDEFRKTYLYVTDHIVKVGDKWKSGFYKHGDLIDISYETSI